MPEGRGREDSVKDEESNPIDVLYGLLEREIQATGVKPSAEQQALEKLYSAGEVSLTQFIESLARLVEAVS